MGVLMTVAVNLPTVAVASIIAAVVIAIIVKAIINKKNGKSICSCGHSCGGCAMKGMCHPDEKE